MSSQAEVQILVHDGERIRPASEGVVPVLDHGFLFGDSVYDVVRTANGRPFLLSEHLDRLRRSAAMIYFEIPWSDEEIASRVVAVGARLGSPECYFRIIATRGPGPISLLPDGCDHPGLYVVGRELIRYPERMFESGCDLAVVPRLRVDPRAVDTRAKTGNYLNNMLGLVEAKRAGADDALFLNAEGHLTEATTSNVWIVEEGVCRTPPLGEGLLAGITRDWIFQTLPPAGIPVQEAVIDLERLRGASEVFVSGTIKGIMPVRSLDGCPVGDGKPGPVASKAALLYADALAKN